MGSRCLENLPNVSDLRKIFVVWSLLPHLCITKSNQTKYISTEMMPVEIDKNGHSYHLYPARLHGVSDYKKWSYKKH